jgi:hypothetical protein
MLTGRVIALIAVPGTPNYKGLKTTYVSTARFCQGCAKSVASS